MNTPNAYQTYYHFQPFNLSMQSLMVSKIVGFDERQTFSCVFEGVKDLQVDEVLVICLIAMRNSLFWSVLVQKIMRIGGWYGLRRGSWAPSAR